MSINYKSSATGNNGGGSTSFSISLPLGTGAGDVMIALFAVLDPNTNVHTPNGWVQCAKNDITNTYHQIAFYKVAGSSEPPSYTFTLDVNLVEACGIIATYSGVDNNTPVNATSGRTGGGTFAVTAPSASAGVTNCQLVCCFGMTDKNAVPWTAPTGETLRNQVNSNNATACAISDEALTGTGATGDRTASASSNQAWIGQQIILEPVQGPIFPWPKKKPRPPRRRFTRGQLLYRVRSAPTMFLAPPRPGPAIFRRVKKYRPKRFWYGNRAKLIRNGLDTISPPPVFPGALAKKRPPRKQPRRPNRRKLRGFPFKTRAGGMWATVIVFERFQCNSLPVKPGGTTPIGITVFEHFSAYETVFEHFSAKASTVVV
jgi:hypothetical protein